MPVGAWLCGARWLVPDCAPSGCGAGSALLLKPVTSLQVAGLRPEVGCLGFYGSWVNKAWASSFRPTCGAWPCRLALAAAIAPWPCLPSMALALAPGCYCLVSAVAVCLMLANVGCSFAWADSRT